MNDFDSDSGTDTRVTEFSTDRLPVYRAAVAQWNRKNITCKLDISVEPRVPETYVLRWSGRQLVNHTKFWTIFKEELDRYNAIHC